MNTCSIPFYIAAPTTTIDPSLTDGSSIPIEERNPAEVTHHQGQQVAAPGIDVSRTHSLQSVEMQCQCLLEKCSPTSQMRMLTPPPLIMALYFPSWISYEGGVF